MATELDFLYISGRIKVLETRLLGKNIFERILDAEGPEEALRVLSDTEYSDGIADMKNIYDFESLLANNMKRTLKVLKDSIKDHRYIRFFTLKYDYHNLKVITKSKILGKNIEGYFSELGDIKPDEMKKLLSEDTTSDLPKNIVNYYNVAIKTYEISQDPQQVDMVIDKALFKEMGNIAKEVRDPFLQNYLSVLIDLTNIKIFVRLKKMKTDGKTLRNALILGGKLGVALFEELFTKNMEEIILSFESTDYFNVISEGLSQWEETGSSATFEKLTDNYLLNFARKGLYTPFGSEPLIGYILGKENEIKILRILLVGKINDVPEDMIRERLRDVYV